MKQAVIVYESEFDEDDGTYPLNYVDEDCTLLEDLGFTVLKVESGKDYYPPQTFVHVTHPMLPDACATAKQVIEFDYDWPNPGVKPVVTKITVIEPWEDE